MPNRKLVTLALSATALGGAVLAAPAASADTVTTTFSVTAGTLSVASAAATADLGSSTAAITGTAVDGALPKVTVTDNRGSLAGWSAQIASTDFTATVNSTTQTIAAAKAKAYVPVGNGPTLLSAALSAVPATTAVDAATGVALSSTAATLVSATTTGSNRVEYTPRLRVTVDASVISGSYSGTITHSVV